MRRSLRPAIIAIAAAAALVAPAAAQASCPDENVEPNSVNLAEMRAATLCLLNAERTPRGLPALRENAKLTDASQEYSQLMVDRSFFAHVTPDGVDLVQRLTSVGYIVRDAAWTVGENLAWGTGGLATPKRIMQAWMDSPGHRANVLTGEFREVGLGVVLGAPHSKTAPGAATYTTDFGVLGDGAAGGDAATPTTTTTRTATTRRPSAKTCRALRRAKARRKLTRTESKRLARCAKTSTRRR